MNKKLKLGVLGCGDFFRGATGGIKRSQHVEVKALFDPDRARSEKYAHDLQATAVASADEIFDDPAIDVVCLFTPPWLRKDMVLSAARTGKHILTTKPLGPNDAECRAMVAAVEKAGIRCGVMYRRTGGGLFETLKTVFDSGEIGRLALYKQDWIHHYPQWNQWATDPKKNGGPFMDAMIHNLNIARYLMGCPATHATFFSDNHVQKLKCKDTEFMKVDFQGGGAAHLFITWAADLAVYSTEGNNREHIDLFYMVTDQGWHVTIGSKDNQPIIEASRNGQKKTWPIKSPSSMTMFDQFAVAVENRSALPSALPDIVEAAQDIAILEQSAAQPGKRVSILTR